MVFRKTIISNSFVFPSVCSWVDATAVHVAQVVKLPHAWFCWIAIPWCHVWLMSQTRRTSHPTNVSRTTSDVSLIGTTFKEFIIYIATVFQQYCLISLDFIRYNSVGVVFNVLGHFIWCTNRTLDILLSLNICLVGT